MCVSAISDSSDCREIKEAQEEAQEDPSHFSQLTPCSDLFDRIDELTVSENFIYCTSYHVADIAAESLQFTANFFRANTMSNQSIYYCNICQASNFPKHVQDIISEFGYDYPLRRYENKQKASPLISLENGTFRKSTSTIIIRILKILRSYCHILATEIYQGIALFRRICANHYKCSSFVYLFWNSLQTMFLTCILLAHKASTDTPYKNSDWENLFGYPPSSINQFEITTLDFLDWNVTVDCAEYLHERRILISQCDFYRGSDFNEKADEHLGKEYFICSDEAAGKSYDE